MKKILLGLLSSVMLVMATTANATLIDRGGGLIYDDVLNITWLQDANYAKTSGYDADGIMTWDNAMVWAGNLVYGGYDDWRLTSITDTGAPGCDWASSGTDCGFNVDTAFSELAYMYHVNLGLESYLNEDGSFDPTFGLFGNDTGLIMNFQSEAYWSGTEYAPSPQYAWLFNPSNGGQDYLGKGNERAAWAVRPGDVAAQAVPAPGVLTLLGLGLIGMSVIRRPKNPKITPIRSKIFQL